MAPFSHELPLGGLKPLLRRGAIESSFWLTVRFRPESVKRYNCVRAGELPHNVAHIETQDKEMSLDLRTMMLMISVLTLLLSGLLALAGLHAGSIRGVRLWALASLYYSLASFIAFAGLASTR
ncbi:MAG TPA: hypothetical protein VMV97_07550, partial [Sulfuriferula sp.]|nr:hypothetical protein [Sulfuriferula sp.]